MMNMIKKPGALDDKFESVLAAQDAGNYSCRIFADIRSKHGVRFDPPGSPKFRQRELQGE
jgi:hypothetical protein